MTDLASIDEPAAPSPAARTPALYAASARIEIDGAVALASFDVETTGDRVLLVGAVSTLVTAIAGARPRSASPASAPVTARVVGGELRVAGSDVALNAHRGVCGVALCDPPLPPRWTVGEYLVWGARLDGASRRQGRMLAGAAMKKLSLRAIGKRRLQSLSLLERRATVLAGAIVSEPAVVLIEAPFDGLDEREAGLMLGALGRASAGRAAIVCLPRVQLTGAAGELAKSASDIVLLRDGRVVAHQRAADLFARGRLYELTVLDRADVLQEKLAAQGLRLEGGPHHFSVVLGQDQSASVLLTAAALARAPVTHCVPIIG